MVPSYNNRIEFCKKSNNYMVIISLLDFGNRTSAPPPRNSLLYVYDHYGKYTPYRNTCVLRFFFFFLDFKFISACIKSLVVLFIGYTLYVYFLCSDKNKQKTKKKTEKKMSSLKNVDRGRRHDKRNI